MSPAADKTRAYLALGSNLGDRAHSLARAIELLAAAGTLLRRSTVHETEPWGPVSQRDYLNQAVELESALPPHELLDLLLDVERRMGRTRTVRYGPRTLDIDILLYGDLVVRDEKLVLPHPRLAERRFVLAPLCEIAPELVHPVLGVTVAELLRRLPED